MNELALFAGAGGGILGGHLLGWRTVCAVEWADYPRRVLLARQRDGILPRFPIWDDVQTFDGKPWRGRVDVISGGFPCQDISAAGKGAGIDGAKSGMWHHMARIVREVRPRFVFVENSPMLTSRGLGRVLGDLAAMGYDAEWGVLGADDCGAPHKRDRIWILGNLAHASSWGRRKARRFRRKQSSKRPSRKGEKIPHANPPRRQGQREPSGGPAEISRTGSCGANLANANSRRCGGEENWEMEQQRRTEAVCGSAYLANPANQGDVRRIWGMGTAQASDNHRRGAQDGRGEWWAAEPAVGRVANGVANRVDRLKAIGNGQVSLVAATAFRILSERVTHEIERGER